MGKLLHMRVLSLDLPAAETGDRPQNVVSHLRTVEMAYGVSNAEKASRSKEGNFHAVLSHCSLVLPSCLKAAHGSLT